MILLGAICFIVGGVVIALAKAGVGKGSAQGRERKVDRLFKKDYSESKDKWGDEKKEYDDISKLNDLEENYEKSLEHYEKSLINSLTGHPGHDIDKKNKLLKIYEKEYKTVLEIKEELAKSEQHIEEIERYEKKHIKEDKNLEIEEIHIEKASGHSEIHRELHELLKTKKGILDDEIEIFHDFKKEERIDNIAEHLNEKILEIINDQIRIFQQDFKKDFKKILIKNQNKKHHILKKRDHIMHHLRKITARDIKIIREIGTDLNIEEKEDSRDK